MLIAIACYDTEANGRSKFTARTLESLERTVDLNRHRVVLVDNASCQETREILHVYESRLKATVIRNEANLGTARAINQAWRLRKHGEHAVKMDNDVVIHQSGWANEIEEVFQRDPTVGICGLKRKDLEERPGHPNKWYASVLTMLPHKPGERWIVLEEVHHCLGTCQAYSSPLLTKIGYLYQMQDLGCVYAFDDALASARAHLAGFRVGFLPHYQIDHIDPGDNAYCEEKRKQAGQAMAIYERVRDEYMKGTRPLYWEDPA